MPSSLKMAVPAIANTRRTAVIVAQARRAIWNRCAGVLSTVMARNAGAVAIGSTITNNELTARELYSATVMKRWRQDQRAVERVNAIRREAVESYRKADRR